MKFKRGKGNRVVRTTLLTGCQVIFLCKSMMSISVYARRCYHFVSVQHEFHFTDTKLLMFFQKQLHRCQQDTGYQRFFLFVWALFSPKLKQHTLSFKPYPPGYASLCSSPVENQALIVIQNNMLNIIIHINVIY